MKNMLKINDTLVNPDHITHIELDTKVYDYETSQYRPGLIIHMAVAEVNLGVFRLGRGPVNLTGWNLETRLRKHCGSG